MKNKLLLLFLSTFLIIGCSNNKQVDPALAGTITDPPAVEVADLAAAKDNLGGGGTSTLALKVGGDPTPGGATEEWNWETLTVKTVTVS